MSEEQQNLVNKNNEIDLLSLIGLAWNKKKLIVAVTLACSVLALILALLTPNQYTSSALLQAKDASGGAGVTKSMSSLGALAGVNLGGGAAADKNYLIIRTLTAVDFFYPFYSDDQFLIELMAYKSFNSSSGELEIDSSIYDKADGSWVEGKPSLTDSHIVFVSNHLSILFNEDEKFITLSLKHHSPYVAHKWSKRVLSHLNEYFKLEDKRESQDSLKYLREKIVQTKIIEIKQVLAAMIQDRTQKLMLSEISEEYIVAVVDSPRFPEKKSEPKRSYIVISGILIGFFLSLIYVVFRHLTKEA